MDAELGWLSLSVEALRPLLHSRFATSSRLRGTGSLSIDVPNEKDVELEPELNRLGWWGVTVKGGTDGRDRVYPAKGSCNVPPTS